MRSTVLALLLALGLVAGCSNSPEPAPAPSTSPSASPGSQPAGPVKATADYFGVSDADPIGASWPDAPVGSLRVWDAGVAWNQIEKSPGVFDFSRLDAIVATARAQKASVLLVLGQTPSFHATVPSPDAAYGPGASSMPQIDAWTKYVRTIVARYHAPDIEFQVWNEVNVINYWSGDQAQMAQLTQVARQVVDSIDPEITLVAPAFVTRLASQQKWMDEFWAQQVDGKPVADLIDVVSLQLYPVPKTPTPEASMEQLATDREILARHNIDKPVWNTEINYGAGAGREVAPAPPEEQANNVARTYLLNAANGVGRVYWYVWDLTAPILNTFMVEADGRTPTAAGRAFRTVHGWMLGTTPKGCKVDGQGTYTCTYEKAGGTRYVYWNPTATAQVKVPTGATTSEKLIGNEQPASPGASLTVDAMPVLVTTSGTAGG
jgi:hypothetical protein